MYTFEEWLLEYHNMKIHQLSDEETVAYFEVYELWRGEEE